MVKINRYLLVAQLLLLNIVGQNTTHCAARIQSAKKSTALDSELIRAAIN